MLRALIWAAAGYLAGALLTYALVQAFSPNTHDRVVEAGMTAAFFGGPVGALVGAIAAILRRRSRPAG